MIIFFKIYLINLQKNKSLGIIKYNKKIQNRLNINIEDYKKYLEIFTPIEIEIIPKENIYGIFINIKKEEELFYHIYFNDSKEEIKKNKLSENDKVSIIKIKIDYQVKSFDNLFSGCNCVESIIFKKFYRNNITNMSGMFNECSSLKEINSFNFNTNNVTNMTGMFSGCSSLEKLSISKFNTDNVTDMSFMFWGCSN